MELYLRAKVLSFDTELRDALREEAVHHGN